MIEATAERRADLNAKIFRLAQKEYHCSQMLILLGLELQGKANPDLVRAVDGLNGGLGFAGKTCGALTGAVCLLGLYAGRGPLAEKRESDFFSMVGALVDWFEDAYARYSSTDCSEIISAVPLAQSILVCREIVAETFLKVLDILQSNGYDLTKGRDPSVT